MATQTGSIDLTASNSVKLMAEAGFESVEENYYTKSELDVTVQGINTEVSKKVNGTEIISTINQSAESVSINANKINLQGAVTISDLSSDAQSATLNSNISVGGRNLLTGTGDWSDWYNEQGSWTFSGEVATSPVKSTLLWAALDSVGIPLEDCYDRTFTLSIDYRSDDWSSTTGVPYLYVNVKTQSGSAESASRKKYRRIDGSKFVPTTEWQRAVITFTVGSDESWFTSGTAGGTHMAVQVYNYSLNQLQIRHVQLEIGNIATDWTSAPEDMAVAVGGRNLLANSGTGKNWSYSTFADGVYTRSTTATSESYVLGRTVAPLELGDTYTLSAWMKTNGQVSSVDMYLYDHAVKTVRYKRLGEITTEWALYTFTVTMPDSWVSGTNTVDGWDARFDNNGSKTSGTEAILYVKEPKLEKGNTTTDWTPAPEDVDSAISDAAKTATSYVTEVTGQNGIMVHPSTDDDTGVRITSDVDIMRGGNSVLNVGTQGDTTSTDAGVTIYDGTASKGVVASFDKDGIGLVGGAFRLTSVRVTEEYGDESNPTTSTEIRSTINTEASNDSYATRCFLRSGLTEGDAAGGGVWELVSETDINPEFPTDTKNASVEVGSDPWGSSVRLVADSQELDLSKNPMDNKDYFTLNSEVFLLTDYHNGVCVFSTMPGTILWSGTGWHMTSGHTANLAYNVSTCPTGIVLHFQPYTGSTVRNYWHNYYFVPKEHVSSYNGVGIVVHLCAASFQNMGTKYLYVYDNKIVGNDDNNTSGTNSGITYNNALWVMTQVIAV